MSKTSECLHAVSEGEERAVACRNAPEWELGCEHASGKGGKSFLRLSWWVFQNECRYFSLSFGWLIVWRWWRYLLICCSLHWHVHTGSWANVGVYFFGLFSLWRSLPDEERAHYFKEAEQLRRLHKMKHPGWSCKDNYVSLQHVNASPLWLRRLTHACRVFAFRVKSHHEEGRGSAPPRGDLSLSRRRCVWLRTATTHRQRFSQFTHSHGWCNQARLLVCSSGPPSRLSHSTSGFPFRHSPPAISLVTSATDTETLTETETRSLLVRLCADRSRYCLFGHRPCLYLKRWDCLILCTFACKIKCVF